MVLIDYELTMTRNVEYLASFMPAFFDNCAFSALTLVVRCHLQKPVSLNLFTVITSDEYY